MRRKVGWNVPGWTLFPSFFTTMEMTHSNGPARHLLRKENEAQKQKENNSCLQTKIPVPPIILFHLRSHVLSLSSTAAVSRSDIFLPRYVPKSPSPRPKNGCGNFLPPAQVGSGVMAKPCSSVDPCTHKTYAWELCDYYC